MFEVITFPSASKISKLSASPTTKIPQSTDWIFQDFFDTMLDGDLTNMLSPTIQISELFPQENLLRHHHSIFENLYETYNESDKLSLPELESNKSSDDEDEEIGAFQVVGEGDIDYLYEEDSGLQDLNSHPVLIESIISSVDDSSIASITDVILTETPFHTLSKRKSSTSFSSLKSNIMNALHLNKKSKPHYDTDSLQKSDTASSKSSVSLKLKKYFKFRL